MYVRKIKVGDDVLLIPDSTEALATKADYEEGTWTPSLYKDPDTAAETLRTSGFYKKIGKLVYIRGHIQLKESAPCHHIGGIPQAIVVNVPIMDDLLSVYISNYNSNVLNVGASGGDMIYNIGYNQSDSHGVWIIEGCYLTY